MRFWLLDLVEELSVSLRTDSLPEVLALDRVWITADGRAVLLDFPVPVDESAPSSASPALGLATGDPRHFLCHWVVASLAGRGAVEGNIRPSEVAVPLPPHARDILRDLETGPFPGRLLEKIRQGFNHFARVSVGHRAAVLMGCCGVPLFAAILGSFAFFLSMQLIQGQSPTARLRRSLDQWQAFSNAASMPGASNEVHLAKKAFEVYIAGQFRSTITNPEAWGDFSGAIIPSQHRKAAEDWIYNRPPPTETELKQASKTVEPFLKGEPSLGLDGMRVVLSKPLTVLSTAAWTLTLGSALPSLMAAILFRGGLVLRLCGLTVVRIDGARASRLRLAWRAIIAWGPVTGLALVSLGWKPGPSGFSWQTNAEIIAVACVFFGLVIWAGLFPGRGIHDRLAGTCLIPRE